MKATAPVTCLSLLTRDGAVSVVFSPPLDSDHYAELHEISCEAVTAGELRSLIQAAALKWGLEATIG